MYSLASDGVAVTMSEVPALESDREETDTRVVLCCSYAESHKCKTWTITYGSEKWTWNGAQQSIVHAVEMSYLRGACGVNRWDGLSNESVYERCGMIGRGSGVGCGVVEWMKRGTLRWFGHIEMRGKKKYRVNLQ